MAKASRRLRLYYGPGHFRAVRPPAGAGYLVGPVKLPSEAGIKLRAIMDRIVSDPIFAPEKDALGRIKKTKCNLALQVLAEEVGYPERFEKKLANQIMAILETEAKKHSVWFAWYQNKKDPEPEKGEWCEVSGGEANVAANLGAFAVAACYGKPHGHVAGVYPGAMVWSSKWKKDCPVVANVGQSNKVTGSNWAFSDEPRYFICKKDSIGKAV